MPNGVFEGNPVAGQGRIKDIKIGNDGQIHVNAESSGNGQPAKVQGKNQHEDEAEPENWHAHADERTDHAQIVKNRILLGGGYDAQNNPQNAADDKGDNGKFNCGRKPLPDLGPDFLAGADRLPQIAFHQPF